MHKAYLLLRSRGALQRVQLECPASRLLDRSVTFITIKPLSYRYVLIDFSDILLSIPYVSVFLLWHEYPAVAYHSKFFSSQVQLMKVAAADTGETKSLLASGKPCDWKFCSPGSDRSLRYLLPYSENLMTSPCHNNQWSQATMRSS